jgi:hypothetical protein
MSVGVIKSKVKGSTRLGYTGLCGGLEHLTEIETRLIRERFASVMGEKNHTSITPSVGLSLRRYEKSHLTLVY